MSFEVVGSVKPPRPVTARPAVAGALPGAVPLEAPVPERVGVAVTVLAIVAFLLYSRIVELIPIRGLFLFLSATLLLYAAITHRLRYLRNTPSALFLFMTVWMVAAGLLGMYPGGSAERLTEVWARSLLAYVVVVCMATHLGAVRRLMAAIAWCLPAFSVLSVWLPGYVDGRLMILVSTLANPNDFALFLVVALPFGVWYVAESRHWTVLRLIVAASVFHAVIMLVQTGSRGGMMSAIAVLITGMVLCGRNMRMVLGVSALAAALIGLAVVPQSLQQRYVTIVYDDVPETEGSSASFAVGSKYARLELFLTSLRATAEHPLFGVGPGMFPDYIGMKLREQGRQGPWQQTHNAYTQMSAEAGIPAALAFLGVVLFCWRHANRVRKAALTPALRQHAGMSVCLLAALTGYAFCALFSSIALLPVLPLITGVTVGLEESFRKATWVPEPAAATAAAGTGSR
ncbi:MAG TPA: O-antigen ligase family protein [Bryobacteraceae bacterium]|nr:O-antigen ligase family protein [Bryobacteraceae bacterium]